MSDEDLANDNLAWLDDEQIREYAEMAQAEIERLQGLIDRHDAIREVGGCPSPIEFYALEDKTNE